MSFGVLVRRLRKEKNVSQRELAAQVSVDYTYISKIENDKMDPPSEATIIKMAKVLGENPDLLLAAAGKVSSELLSIIMENLEVPKFLRMLSGKKLTPEVWEKLFQIIEEDCD